MRARARKKEGDTVAGLSKKQIQCIKMLADGSLMQKEIAQQLKVSEQTICNWKRKPEFAAEYNDAVRENIRFAAGKAYAKQVELLDSPDGRVASAAAADLLDRAGFKPDGNINLNGNLPVVIVGDDAIPE
jgi:uncharacterized protein YjcR